MKKHWLLLLAVCAGAVMVLGSIACGVGDDGMPATSEATPTEEADEQTTTPTTAPAAATAKAEPRVVSRLLYQEDPDGTQHVLTVYAPAAEGGPWPVTVMLHGLGGSGDRMNLKPSALAAEGVVVFAPTWPEPPLVSAEAALAGWNATVERTACAVRFARSEAEAYGGDPSNLSLYGESGGANLASIIAFADPGVPEGCLAPSGPVVPDHLVLFEGDWLWVGTSDLANTWDKLLEEDLRVMVAVTPWSYLFEAAHMPIHILDANDLLISRSADGADAWLKLRDPTGDRHRDLEVLGAFDDGVVAEREAQRLLYMQLLSLGYDVAFHDLPDSTHNHFSEAAARLVIDVILSRTASERWPRHGPVDVTVFPIERPGGHDLGAVAIFWEATGP